MLRFAGRDVDVQNYIDNTGVQVADVIVGFLHIEKKQWDEIEELSRQPRFDYYCWDLYARVSQWYELDKENRKARLETLHAIEQGGNETAAIADLISVAVLRRHLETMDRLDIEYDFLPRESEILHLHFWDAAFEKLKAAGVLTLETEGKNKGCWVMRRAGTSAAQDASSADANKSPKKTRKSLSVPTARSATLAKTSPTTCGSSACSAKISSTKYSSAIPTSTNAGFRRMEGEPDHPHFGSVSEIYNVIDARQSEAQNTVIEALRGLGYNSQADHYTHFSYEMVALTPRCAAELGYHLSEEDKTRSYIEVSGRKGFGVKADDLLDTLIASAKKEVDSRNAELHEHAREKIANQIAVGALRYFMLKYTKPSVIAFDFKDALSFEGDTGPYAQYAVVRATNIFRKGDIDPEKFSAEGVDFAEYLGNDEIWELWLAASQTSYVVDQAIATTEPAYLAKHTFRLAQLFNAFYHRHPILSESDEARKKFLLATAAVVRRELIRALGVMGITVPSVM